MVKEQLIAKLIECIDEQFGVIADKDETFFEFFDALIEVTLVESKIVDEALWYNVRHSVYKFEDKMNIVFFRAVHFVGKNHKLPTPSNVNESIDDIRIVHPKVVTVTKYIEDEEDE